MIESDKSKNMSELDDLLENSYLNYSTEQDIQDELDDKLEKKIRQLYNMEDVDKSIIRSQPQFIFAKKLRTILKDRNIKGIDSQELFGITPGTLSKYINGSTFPKQKEIARIANALKISTSYFTSDTDITSFSAQEINKAIGLSENAICSLYKLYHNVEEFNEVDDNIPPCEEKKEFLEIFSLFLSNYSNFCEFLTYQRQYVKTKQEINEFNNNKDKGLNDKLQREYLNDKLERN